MSQSPPRLSAVVITYNQSAFIEAALQSVFAQTYPDMQIVISDDCSTDDNLQVIRRYVARHGAGRDIVICQTPRNSGLAANINNGFAAATGDVFVIFAGDDVSLPERCQKVAEAMAPDVFCVTSAADEVDINLRKIGVDPGWHGGKPLRAESFADPHTTICGAAGVYHRKVFDVFGPLRAGANCEDQVLPFRAALLGRIAWIKEPLVLYRRHGKNISTAIDPNSIGARAFSAHTKLWTRHKYLSMEQKVADLQTFLARYPEQRAALAEAQILFERSLRQSLTMDELAAHKPRGVAALARQVTRGETSVKEALKMFLMMFTPPLWLLYLRHFSRPRPEVGL